ncbi:MAG: UDP-4-amino-4,6-dideoxy-N-acetyl-beta-L-altrosamine transaminase [Candidatus Omnitrophica bacterium]|nr:UDP-4-amino-4,6-dideoxy-N-acetyl-beta-L-altrosamine transaminase [Candidatus Omnitrophota bacterium]
MKTIPYGQQRLDSADIKSVVTVLRSEWLTQGPRVKDFERALCRYTGARYAVVVSSGTAALHIACLAAEISKGDEIITSPVTFAASANCAVYCGGRPTFADVRENTINIDPEKIAANITKKTRVIIPVHFAGNPCDLTEIHAIARKNGLIVIEDACHALGAEYKAGRRWLKIGSCRHSDMAVFSFHPVKTITAGEGGAVLTNDATLYERLLLLRNHGITRNRSHWVSASDNLKDMCITSNISSAFWYYEMQLLGYNYRITDIQCALGISQMKKVDAFVESRRQKADAYQKELGHVKGLRLPCESEGTRSSWHIYPVRVSGREKRQRLFEYLLKNGIGSQVHYIPVHLQPYYRREFGTKNGDCPVAEEYFKQCLSIPLYPGLSWTDQSKVIRNIKGFFKND